MKDFKDMSPQERYQRKNSRFVRLMLLYTTDLDIITKLESTGNMQGYIKALIRADIDKQNIK